MGDLISVDLLLTTSSMPGYAKDKCGLEYWWPVVILKFATWCFFFNMRGRERERRGERGGVERARGEERGKKEDRERMG